MKILLLTLLALGAVVHGQNTKADQAFMSMTLPVVNMTDEEVKAYEANPDNKPRLLGKMPKTGKKQPASAGVSYIKTSQQIVGGSRASLTQFPWQIYLIADKGWLCGGSLIAANWVLTAAHCVSGARSFSITVGGIDRLSTESNEKTQTSKAATRHESYNSRSLVNDIAVIKMPANFVLNTFINVIRLPKPSQGSTTFAGNTVTASGYGMSANTGPASSYMNWVDLVVLANPQCAQVYGSTTVTSSVICTTADPAKQICSGDSGGPLMFREDDGKFTQVGVVSFGAAASCTGYPAGFSRVTSFLTWIATKTGIITTG